MFKKLHIRLTLIMALILMIFMFFLAYGIYHFTSVVFERSTKQGMKMAIEQIETRNNFKEPFRMPFFDHPEVNRKFLFNENPKWKVNYIVYDKFFDLAYVKNEDANIAEDIMEYAVEAFDKKAEIYAKKEVDGVSYRIYTKYINEDNIVGVVQLYVDTTYELIFLNFLKSVLLFIGSIGMVIMVGISYFFTGRVIKPVKKSWIKQKEFVADASHELRTPLTVIQTNLDAALCDEEGTIKENHIWLDNAYSETIIMGELIKQLLTLAKIDANQIKLEIETIDLSEVINQTIDNVRIIADKKGIDIISEIEEDILLEADNGRIRQLLVILIDNAIKYTNKGEILVKLHVKKGKKIITLEDTGIGIAKEEVGRVFDRFYRADKARYRQEGGTGLGLSIAKWIVEVHNGTIEVESDIGKGSTFTIIFN